MITTSTKWDPSSLEANKAVSTAVSEAGPRDFLYLFLDTASCVQNPLHWKQLSEVWDLFSFNFGHERGIVLVTGDL